MATRTVINGVGREEYEAALAAWRDDPSPANERALIEANDAIGNLRAGCGECIAKRAEFFQALQSRDPERIAATAASGIGLAVRKILRGWTGK